VRFLEVEIGRNKEKTFILPSNCKRIIIEVKVSISKKGKYVVLAGMTPNKFHKAKF
jgi:hypothetical protein